MKHGNPLSRITYSSVSLMPSLFRTLEFNDFSLVVHIKIDSNNFEKILAYGVLLMYNNRACLMR